MFRFHAFSTSSLHGFCPRSARTGRWGRNALWFTCLLTISFLITGCEGIQSALNPAGRDAALIAQLYWWMVGGAVIIWLIVVGLAVYALQINATEHDYNVTRFWVIGGGAVAPTIILTVLLVYGLSMMPTLLEPAPEGSQTITVIGKQWWWKVRYHLPEGQAVELANEIRLPVDEPVQFYLESADVIHSFWIPSLGGKVDMLPGRQTRLTLHPQRTGIYRGVCAEYCGGSHAKMSFEVVVMERDAFDTWLEQQQAPAKSASNELAERGESVFLAHGCGACHTIRGTKANGKIAPDLTHYGSRLRLAASALPQTRDALKEWIAHPKQTKPGVHMPSFALLSEDDLTALAAYLEGLQ
ncbi:Cytochrome c oxidase polypeptide II [Planctomycetales bacterium 10988]|nr:Cytochrome c oxidase polypeptide II [Planctomycetales bacterium 10988]